MITLYHSQGARSFRALWMMHELGIDFRLEVIRFPPRLHAPDYLQRNPLGTIPLLIDGEETLFDSAAILIYLASRGDGGLGLRPSDPGYGEWLSWIVHGESDLTNPLSIILRHSRFLPEDQRAPGIIADQENLFIERLARAASRLEQGPYLCGHRFTAADISVGYALLLSRFIGLNKRWPGPLAEYWSGLKSRPAFGAAIAVDKPSS